MHILIYFSDLCNYKEFRFNNIVVEYTQFLRDHSSTYNQRTVNICSFCETIDVPVVLRFRKKAVEMSISHEIKEMLFENGDIVLSLRKREFT